MPDFTKPFILEADACGYGLGAVLMQEGIPLAYFSKSIGPKAAAMSTYDKEALAIIEAMKKWRHYFLATALVIRTDQESLKYIQEQKITEGIQHKLLLKLLGYVGIRRIITCASVNSQEKWAGDFLEDCRTHTLHSLSEISTQYILHFGPCQTSIFAYRYYQHSPSRWGKYIYEPHLAT